jgi:TonB family protein
MPDPASASAESTSREPPAYRLVIRAQLVAAPIPQASAEPNTNKRTLAFAAVAIALLGLGWAGFSAFQSDPAAPQPAILAPTQQVTAADESRPAPPSPVEPDTPLRPVDQVTPTASPGALKTIRGTIRVTIEVTIDPQGHVIDAVAAEPGPSRYFERVSLDASRKWTFTPANTDAKRSTRLRFQFTRSGATTSLAGEAH